jgi:hypothetical protein
MGEHVWREAATDEERARASARLRQRFKTVKDELRKRAIEVGLIDQGNKD